MFGMIKNSLFGGHEVINGKLILKGEKDGVSYEEREYEGGKFATVEVSGKPFDEASKEAVLLLLKYVGGANQKGAGMGMTAPVSMISFPTEDDNLQPKVKVILRIPSQFQADPPTPTESNIHIEDRDALAVYSTQFGGFAKETDYVSHASKLRSALGPDASYHTDFYMCNGYDPPMKPYGRRNEVWLVKK
ncbi:heme-binding protein 1 [Bombina bombina]|uniref:heme-binding protein 1 n=1 Tax=Bombina bombina TaxID=8345 RepID=UPI00235A5A39|nr:heme-binding protein 1 [Bombina bombina]